MRKPSYFHKNFLFNDEKRHFKLRIIFEKKIGYNADRKIGETISENKL